jgi:hypothetical protein
MKKFKILFSIIIIFFGVRYCNKCCTGNNSDNETVIINDSTAVDASISTLMKIYNHSKDTALVYITLGATPGCLQSAISIPFIQDTISGQRGLQGFFLLNPGDSTIAYAPDSLGYNGVVSFNFQPNNCPTSEYPNGINQFEFILNNSFQGVNAQESINISCVHGVNCVIRVDAITNNPFNAGPTFTNVQSFANTMDRSSIGIPGVYPYGCDTCTGSKNPPSCITLPQPKQSASICQVQRNAIQSGGLIKIIYLGTAEPSLK